MQTNNKVIYLNRSNCEMRLEDICDCKKNWKKIIRIKDHETNIGEFDIYFCENCKLGFTEPYPSEETSGYLYETKNSSDFDLISNSVIDKIKDFLAIRQLIHLARKKTINSVLDYATGNGRFAFCAKKAFPLARIDAVDYQKAPPQLIAQASASINYFNLTTFESEKQLYDIILLRHVLEHTHHPVQLLRSLRDRLTKDGFLYIEVPNLESGCAKVFGKYWKGYYVPRHIYHYTKDSLKEIINKSDLHAEISRNEMPFMGNTISIITGLKITNKFVQLFGLFLHPIQILIEIFYKSSTCLNAKCRYANKSDI